VPPLELLQRRPPWVELRRFELEEQSEAPRREVDAVRIAENSNSQWPEIGGADQFGSRRF
jgi:hypothetical protein